VPTTFLLEDATLQLNRCFEILETYKKDGIPAVMGLLATQFAGMDSPGSFKPDLANLYDWFQNEFLVMTIYCPDLRKVVQNKVSVAVMAGEKSKDAFYARITIGQAEFMQCSRVMVPGNHFGFDFEVEAFAPVLIETLDMLEKKRHSDLALKYAPVG
jgi:hypothetical protein